MSIKSVTFYNKIKKERKRKYKIELFFILNTQIMIRK